MKQHHWRIWTCGICPHTSFDKSILLESHLEEEHALLDTSQIDTSVRAGKGLEKTDDPTRCPLCDESLMDFEAYELHVGRHQEQVAFSILGYKKEEASSGYAKINRIAPDDGTSTHDSKRARMYTPESSPEPGI